MYVCMYVRMFVQTNLSMTTTSLLMFIFYQPKKFSSICDKNEDQDGFLSPPEVFQCTQHLFEETQRREVDEDASGMNSLLFEYIDNDKNGTIELNGRYLSRCCMNARLF